MSSQQLIELDGAHGGGQLLRTALSLSMCTGTPFRMRGIRAGRARPGLMRQHLTAVEAAARIGCAEVIGATPGSLDITFRPGAVLAGDYHFPIGTAGSTTLVLQTVLPALWSAASRSSVRLEGGTHNPLAPSADFLIDAFAPQLRRMNVLVDLSLERHGFYPAGGGAIQARVGAGAPLAQLRLHERGALKRQCARALISAIPSGVAERELAVAKRHFKLADADLEHRSVRPALGPGNAFVLAFEFEHVTEVFTTFGARGISAEQVAERACEEARTYLASRAAVGTYLADQLLLPIALAGGGEFTTLAPSDHTHSNAALIEKFLPVEFEFRQLDGKTWLVACRD